MQEPETFGYFQVSGQMKDDVLNGAKYSIKDTVVSIAPVDALDEIGSDFNIDRSPIFTDAEYRAKLQTNWDYWRSSGTPARLITEVESYGYTGVSIIPQWTEISPGNWVKTIPNIIDPLPAMEFPNDRSYTNTTGVGWWSNFWLVIPQPHPFTPILWGTPDAGLWGTGGPFGPYKWGGIAGDQNAIRMLVALIKKLKPAWTSCRGIIFGYDDFKTWGSFNWDDGTLWGIPTGSYSVYFIREDWET